MCTVEIEESSNENNEHEINAQIDSIYVNTGVEQSSSSSKNDYESKFTQFNYESKGTKMYTSKRRIIK